MLSSASQNCITHLNSAHSQTGSHINTIIFLFEHLKSINEGEKNNCLSLSNLSLLSPVYSETVIVYTSSYFSSGNKYFTMTAVYSTLLESVTFAKTDQCETNVTTISVVGFYEQVLS